MLLPALHLKQPLRRHFGSVRKSRRKARRRRQLGGRQAGFARELTDLGLVEIRFEKRRQHSALAGRSMAGSKIARVIDVHPVRDRVETQLVAQVPEHIEEFGLAVITPVGCVHPVIRIREFLRGHEAVGDVELAGDPLGHRAVARGIRGRLRGDREGVVTQHPVRRIGEITRIDAARKRDQHATRGPE